MATIPKKSLEQAKRDHILLRRYANAWRRWRPLKAKAKRPSDPSTPLPDEPEFNEETLQAFRDVDAGVGVKRYESAADMFADLGL
jgi:hypothetical protein